MDRGLQQYTKPSPPAPSPDLVQPQAKTRLRQPDQLITAVARTIQSSDSPQMLVWQPKSKHNQTSSSLPSSGLLAITTAFHDASTERAAPCAKQHMARQAYHSGTPQILFFPSMFSREHCKLRHHTSFRRRNSAASRALQVLVRLTNGKDNDHSWVASE